MPNHTFLPAVLTVREFARVVRRKEETIRKAIRARRIKAFGPPYNIPNSELARYGVSADEALRVLASNTGEAA